MNAFSSKDDTVGDINEEGEVLEEKTLIDEIKKESIAKIEEVEETTTALEEMKSVVIDTEELLLLENLIEQRRPRSFKRRHDLTKLKSPIKSPSRSPLNRSPLSRSPLSKSPSRSPTSSLNSPRGSIRKLSDLSEDQIVPDIERIKRKDKKKLTLKSKLSDDKTGNKLLNKRRITRYKCNKS
ncbi:hypothetical protein EVAR_12969_1 [Eumeta japonica]|uniref:Uncharacterized protein n=1 Tax=Eumeta variegata TaxID=151549 RepID=A0A4C1TX52_EUMVA|nr:hypothetical protein EVAR_12969_1 [Eumeta japonica]